MGGGVGLVWFSTQNKEILSIFLNELFAYKFFIFFLTIMFEDDALTALSLSGFFCWLSGFPQKTLLQ